LKLRSIAKNQTEVATTDNNGRDVLVLFSYETPVAAHIEGPGYMRTEVHHSATTSRHINKWLSDNGATMAKVETVPQWILDELVN
jgi:hypothetical protein